MSHTTVLAIWPGNKIECWDELPNSHGSALVVWNTMAMRWLGCQEFRYDNRIEELGVLWRRQDIPKYQRAVLLLTSDRAYVLKRDYAQMAKDIRAFLAEFPVAKDRVNHWPGLAWLFEKVPDCPAIGLWCTSVGDNPFDGPWDEKKCLPGPVPWQDCFSVYDELLALEEKG